MTDAIVTPEGTILSFSASTVTLLSHFDYSPETVLAKVLKTVLGEH